MKCLAKATSTLPVSSIQDPSTCNWIQVELFFWNVDMYFQNFFRLHFESIIGGRNAKQAWEYGGSFDKFMVFLKLTIKTVMFFLLHLLWKQFVVVSNSIFVIRMLKTVYGFIKPSIDVSNHRLSNISALNIPCQQDKHLTIKISKNKLKQVVIRSSSALFVSHRRQSCK